MDWAAWQPVLDWGGKLGLGGVAGWFLNRWLGSRDSAADRGRAIVAEARPEVVPSPGSVFWGDHRAAICLVNRGHGAARNIRVTFTGSSACGRVTEIVGGQRQNTPEMRLDDSPFFHRKLDEPAEITVRYRDRFEHEYVVVLPVNQEDGGNNHFGPLPAWGQHSVTEPRLTKKRYRELGGS